MSNLALRVLTAVIGVPVILGLVYLGGWAFAVVVAVAAILAQVELYGLMAKASLRPQRVAGVVLGAALVLRGMVPELLPAAVAFILLLIAVEPFRTGEEQPLTDLAATLFGAIYPAAFLGALVDLRVSRGVWVGDLEAFLLTLLVFVLIWATDTFAYFTGRALGKHPLAPKVSPKKTWEGAVGGALGAIAVAAAFKLSLLDDVLSWVDALVVAVICGMVSQLGDLAESKMKRSVGAKDSGNLLPGHGGMLDRLDALILAAPLVYLYLAYVAGTFDL